ncbi:MAG TPA: glycosyltransferase [Terriglobales bacterium]
MSGPLLQIVSASNAPFAAEIASALGGTVLPLTPTPDQSAASTLRRTLDEVQPGVVLVHDLGRVNPSLLFAVRERGIPYAVFLHDFTPLCPTQRLWHRREEPCSGPGRTGWKCAWCVSGTRGRAAELPLRTLLYRHRPRDWRTALVRADALIAASRFARDFWVEQGAPPERIAVVTPWLDASGIASSTTPPGRRLVYSGGDDLANGAELLASALDLMRTPVQIEVTLSLDAAAQDRFRSRLAAHHTCVFHGSLPPGDLLRLLAGAGAAVEPTRWQQPFSRLVAAAQAIPVPVAATAVGGAAEQIIHGVNGYLADADDPQSLAEAIAAALDPEPSAAWAGPLIAAHAATAATASLAILRQLLDRLAAGLTDPDPALAVEHGPWLARQPPAAADGAALLTAALRHPEEATPAYAARALATSRQWQLDLNRALAFFRASGCTRVSLLGDAEDAGDPESITTALSAWGLGPVAVEALPDGLWHLGEASPSEIRLLPHRFPQARAVVSGWGPELQTSLL